MRYPVNASTRAGLGLITPFIGFAGVYTRNRWLTFFPFNIAYSWGVCVYFYVQPFTKTPDEIALSQIDFPRWQILFAIS